MTKKINGIKYLTIGQAAKIVERSPRTIKNWYEWAELEGRQDELPEVHLNIGRKGTRYFTAEGVNKLLKFRENIVYGEMASLNRTKWGKHGKDIIRNKTGLDQVRAAKEDK